MFPNGQLPIQLGSWILDKQADWLDYWDWFLTTDGQFLYFCHGPSLWHRFLRRPNSHHSYFGEFLVEESPLVPLLRGTVKGDVRDNLPPKFLSATICLSRYSSRIDSTRRPSNYSPAITWVTEHLHTSPSIQHLVDDIANGTAVAVCDGSYFEIHGIGSSAWILSSADGSSWIEEVASSPDQYWTLIHIDVSSEDC